MFSIIEYSNGTKTVIGFTDSTDKFTNLIIERVSKLFEIYANFENVSLVNLQNDPKYLDGDYLINCEGKFIMYKKVSQISTGYIYNTVIVSVTELYSWEIVPVQPLVSSEYNLTLDTRAPILIKDVEYKKFMVNDMEKTSHILLICDNNDDKKMCVDRIIADLMSTNNYGTVYNVIFSDNSKLNNMYAETKPFSYDNLCKTMSDLGKSDEKKFVVIDNCPTNSDDVNLTEFLINAKHYGTTYIVIHGSARAFKPVIRLNIDHIFICRNKNINAYYKQLLCIRYANVLPKFCLFEDTFDLLTDNNSCMVISNNCKDKIHYF